MAKVFIQTIDVEGMGEFPLDMLRHDFCFPYSESDSAKIRETHRDKRIVRILRFTFDKAKQPTYDRWRSFGWTATVVSTDVRQ